MAQHWRGSGRQDVLAITKISVWSQFEIGSEGNA
jgi:hypothetical protein